jgi:hypothetical protein
MYANQSLGKRVARVNFWRTAITAWGEALGAIQLQEGRFLVLAGPNCGDVGALLAFGVNPSRIVSCDLDSSHIGHARTLYPEVRHYACDVRDAVSPGWADCAFLDFCGNVSSGMCDTVIEAAELCCATNALIGVGWQRGREGAAFHQLAATSMPQLRLLANCPSFDTKRQFALVAALAQRSAARGFVLTPQAMTYYTGARVPMAYGWFRREPLIQTRNVPVLTTALLQALKALKQCVTHDASQMTAKRYIEYALKLSDTIGSDAAALALQEPRQRLIAWKAVRTARLRREAA